LRIKAIEVQQQNHALQLQTFNAARFENRLDRIETGVQALQRDFDRTLGKVKGTE
jgi:tRNA1(Val) A37 N6-methylase TrmN6